MMNLEYDPVPIEHHVQLAWEDIERDISREWEDPSGIENPFPVVLTMKSDPREWIYDTYGGHLRYTWLQKLTLNLPVDIEKISDSIGEMETLLYLIIKGRNLRVLPAGITCLRNLQELELQECLGLDQLPPDLNELANLKDLTVRCSNIKFLPSSITKSSNLQVLDLHECYNLQELPPNVSDLIRLRKLSIRICKMINSLPCSITELRNLQVLNLEKCCNPEELPSNMSSLTSLTNLFVRDCNITSLSGCAINGLRNLQILDLRNCSSLEQLPEYLNELVNLEYLSIRGTNIKSLPNSITELYNLQDVDVDECFSLKQLPSNFSIGGGTNNIRTRPHNLADEALPAKCLRSQEEFPQLPPDDFINNMFSTHEQIASINEDDAMMMTSSYHNGEAVVQLVANASDVGRNVIDDETKNKIISNNKPVKGRIQITFQDIEPLLSQGMKLSDAANKLGVCRSTLKRKWKDLKVGPWPSSKMKKHDSGFKQCHANSGSRRKPSSDTTTRTSQETATTRAESGSIATDQNGSSCIFVFKATYKDDIIRFEFSPTSTIAQLKEEVQERLNLEVSKFKLQYQDDDNDWVLLACTADLLHCLHLSRVAGTNRVRLKIVDR